MSMDCSRRSIWALTAASASRRKPCAAPAASVINLARSSKRRFDVWVMAIPMAIPMQVGHAERPGERVFRQGYSKRMATHMAKDMAKDMATPCRRINSRLDLARLLGDGSAHDPLRPSRSRRSTRSLVSIGPLAIRWYALAYIAGLVGGWFYARRLAARPRLLGAAAAAEPPLDDLLVWVALGIILGGRLGYVLFYNLGAYLENPLRDLRGLAGRHVVPRRLLGRGARHRALRARARASSLLAMLDLACAVAPIGLFFGRIANFINGELWGRAGAGLSLAVVFPNGGPLPRHPSQLYEALARRASALHRAAPSPVRLGRLQAAGPRRRHLRRRLCGRAHRLRVLPRARRAARLPVRRIRCRCLGGGITMGMLLSLPMVARRRRADRLALRRARRPRAVADGEAA